MILNTDTRETTEVGGGRKTEKTEAEVSRSICNYFSYAKLCLQKGMWTRVCYQTICGKKTCFILLFQSHELKRRKIKEYKVKLVE